MPDKIRVYGKNSFKKNRNLYLLMLPFLIMFFAFVVLPVLASIILSFTNFDMVQVPQFIGFENYRKLFLNDPIFITALKNTFKIALITGPVGYMLAFFLGWLLNELPKKLRVILTVIFYAPSIAGNVYVIFKIIFSSDPYGYFNAKLLEWGLIDSARLWLQDTKYMMVIVIAVTLWMSLGIQFLTFIAGLQTVDKTLYEAAEIDGVTNRWQELWFVTLPQMKGQLLFGAVVSITSAFNAGAVSTALTGFPSPNYATHTIVNHLTDYGNIRMEMGYASAIAVVLFVIMILSNRLVHKFIRRVGS